MLAAVERGEVAISPVTAARILAEVARPVARSVAGAGGGGVVGPDHLTDREVEVLRLVVAGLRNKEIAAELGISENTTKFHLRNILEKLHAGSRTEVAARAVREGLIPER
jgi:DNA-binding NarL/FixJ family response regulator